MSDQPDLFSGPGLARSGDPDTSWTAATSFLEGKKTDRREVLFMHERHAGAGLTDFELAAMLDRQQTSVGKRRGELRDYGLIEATDLRRAAPSGSPAIVWRITWRGRAMCEKLRTEGK